MTEHADADPGGPGSGSPPAERRVPDGPVRTDWPTPIGSGRRPTPRVWIGLVAMLAVAAVSVTALLWRTGSSSDNATPRSPSVPPSALASAGRSLDPTGIWIVGGDLPVQSGSTDEAVSAAFGQALQFAESGHPDDLGYPWIDPSTGGLVVSAATARGRALLESTSFGVPVRIRDVAHGCAELQKIQDEVTFLPGPGGAGRDAHLPDRSRLPRQPGVDHHRSSQPATAR